MVLMYSPSTRSQSMSVQLLDVPVDLGIARRYMLWVRRRAGEVEKVVGVAHNYDDLVDSPVEIGIFQQFDFQQDGATYHIVVHASRTDYDTGKLQDSAPQDHPCRRGLDG